MKRAPKTHAPIAAEAALEPLRATRLKDEFIARFEGLILSGRFRPGERLPAERDLAASLKVSRPVVHEGLLELAAKGLVRMVPRHGAFVNDYRRQGSVELLTSLFNFTWNDRTLNRRLLDDVLEVRVFFETETARLAALRRTAAQLGELEAVLAREEGFAQLAPEEIARVDFDFHHQVALCSGNDVYPLLLNSFRPMYVSVLGLFYRRPEVLGPIPAMHRRLVESIRERDPEASAQTMGEILRYGEQALRRALPKGSGR